MDRPNESGDDEVEGLILAQNPDWRDLAEKLNG